jgi:hypothetical protein
MNIADKKDVKKRAATFSVSKKRIDSFASKKINLKSQKIEEIVQIENIQNSLNIVSDDGERKWKILRSLGKGGCSHVFLAIEINKYPIEYVAIKFFKEKKQFIAEGRIIQLLNSHLCGRGI